MLQNLGFTLHFDTYIYIYICLFENNQFSYFYPTNSRNGMPQKSLGTLFEKIEEPAATHPGRVSREKKILRQVHIPRCDGRDPEIDEK